MVQSTPLSRMAVHALQYLADRPGEHKATYIGVYVLKRSGTPHPKHAVARRTAANILKGLASRGYVQRLGKPKYPVFTITPKGRDVLARNPWGY